MLELSPDSPLRQAALEIEEHVGEDGWDQPPRLFALVHTADLLAAQPELAGQLGSPDSFTSIEQNASELADHLESKISQISWPAAVSGCAVVVERLMLPPEAQAELLDEVEPALKKAAMHADARRVRLVAAVLRDGRAHSAVRLRDDDVELVEGPELVPALIELLRASMS